MFRLSFVVTVAAASTGLMAGRSQAAEVDPRWRYSAELIGGPVADDTVELVKIAGVKTPRGLHAAIGAGFYAPVGENRQWGGGVRLTSAGHWTVSSDYRLLKENANSPVVSCFRVGLQGEVSPGLAIGPRVGIFFGVEPGGAWKGLRLGVDFGGAAIFGNVIRLDAGLQGFASYLF